MPDAPPQSDWELFAAEPLLVQILVVILWLIWVPGFWMTVTYVWWSPRLRRKGKAYLGEKVSGNGAMWEEVSPFDECFDDEDDDDDGWWSR